MIRLAPIDAAAFREALDGLSERLARARIAPDTEAARCELISLWCDARRAVDLIEDATNRAKAAAVAQLENADVHA